MSKEMKLVASGVTSRTPIGFIPIPPPKPKSEFSLFSFVPWPPPKP